MPTRSYKRIHVTCSELQDMKNSMNREEKVAEVKAKLGAGLAGQDLQALNKAMAMAIELGCESDADVQVCVTACNCSSVMACCNGRQFYSAHAIPHPRH
jgi:hypothetical protein